MVDITVYLNQLNQYYAALLAYHAAYGKWAKAHDLSINSLFILSDIVHIESCT